MKHIIASCIAICFILNVPAASPAGETYTDCDTFVKSLTDGILALYEGKRASPMSELIKDLSIKQCSIELQAPSREKLASTRMYERSRQSVVMLGSIYKCKKCSNWHTSTASGFFLTRSGIIVTNYHVVNHADHAAMGAITSDGKIYPVTKILAADKNSDVAIIQVDGSGFEPMAIVPGPPVGSPIFVIGHPGTRPYTFSTGLVSGYFLSKNTNSREKVKRMTITADYGLGSSGGPVMDECGNVTGIVASTQPVMGGCDHNKYAQMIFKDCVPAESILALIKQ